MQPPSCRVQQAPDELGGLFVQYSPDNLQSSEVQPAAGSTAGSAIPASQPIVVTAGSALVDGGVRPYATRGSAIPESIAVRRPEAYPPPARHEEFHREEPPIEERASTLVDRPRGPRARGAGAPAAQRGRSSQRSGDSGSDDSSSSEGSRETPAELVARRFRELDEFIAANGVDYWYRRRPEDSDQLRFDEEVES